MLRREYTFVWQGRCALWASLAPPECYILQMTTMAATGFIGGERMLYAAIGTSIVVHALAMMYSPKIEPPPPPPPRITATLRAAPAPAPAAAPEPAPAATPEPPPPAPVAEKTPPPPPVPTPAAKPVPTPKMAEKAITKSAAPAQEPTPAAPPPPAAVAPVAAPVAEAPKAAAPAAAPGGSADPSEKSLIDGYQNQLAQVAGKYKRYPNEAMQNNWEGTATVRLKIGADGKIAGVEITSSSGHPILDEQASITINKAKPFVQIPAGLKGKEFVAVVRIVFSLKS